MASPSTNDAGSHRLMFPTNQLWIPGAREFAAVVGIAADWIGRFRIICGKLPTRRLRLCTPPSCVFDGPEGDFPLPTGGNAVRGAGSVGFWALGGFGTALIRYLNT